LLRLNVNIDNGSVANLGANLWGQSEESKTASIRASRIRYQARCQSTSHCAQRAVVQIECCDSVGHPFWNRDFCDVHAKPVIEKAARPQDPGVLALMCVGPHRLFLVEGNLRP
jgi:hypothetical protein